MKNQLSRHFFTHFILLLVLVFIMNAKAQQQNSIQLKDYIQQALKNNPGLEAAEQKVLAVERRIPQAGALPDPQLMLGLMNLPLNSFAFDQEPMTGKVISVMQMFPFPGKLGLDTKMAKQEANSEKYKKEEIENRIVTLVKKTYYNIYAIDRAIETVETNRSLMQQFVRVAETKYATGSGLQQDVLRAQVELTKLEDDLIMWQQKRKAVSARLNALLNRETDKVIPVTFRELSTADRFPANTNLAETRPLLKAWAEMVGKTETSIKRARKNYWPNFSIGAGYSQRDNLENGAVMHDFISTTVSMNIPLYFHRKQRAKVQEQELNLRSMQSQYQNVLNQVKADSAGIMAEMERNRKRIELYKNGILLQAKQSLKSALSGYQVDKVDFLTLINNWTMLQNYELQYFRALADYQISLAQYDFVTGRKWMNETE
ncbi:MAG: TolC family protein [Actinobacteria bacterium]|nr:TolC family protein [Actinomycetota bacterium]